MTPAERFGELLRVARAERKLTQAELAQRAGVSVRAVQSYEVAARAPSWAHVCKLAAGLRLPLERFAL